jgi:hypothetical protein
MDFEFQALPAIGTVIMLDDQEYELADVEPYRRKDGRKTQLLVWSTSCPVCGASFQIKTALKSNGVNRRCAECRTPGKPVKGKRGRKIKLAVMEA